MKRRFEEIEHTADIAIRVWGRDLAELFANAAYGMACQTADVDTVGRAIEHTVELQGYDAETLLVAWLGELLYLFDAKRMLFRKFDIKEVNKYGLKATVRGEPFQPERHVLKRGIKAVTYHQVKVEKKGGKWEGRIIFDL